MSFNGSGTYVLPGSALANGGTVSASEHNTFRSDVATALSTCVTRDGQSPWTANIPAGGYKITGLAAGSSSTDSVRYGQVSDLLSAVTASGGYLGVNLAPDATYRIKVDGPIYAQNSTSTITATFKNTYGGAGQYAVYGESTANWGIYGRALSASFGGTIGVASDGTTYGSLGYSTYGLYTNASISVNGTVYPSDGRLKENVASISNALRLICELNPVSFDWKADTYRGLRNNGPVHDYGLIAQEAELVIPELVSETTAPAHFTDGPEALEEQLGTFKGVDYTKLVPLLVAAVKELKERVDSLS